LLELEAAVAAARRDLRGAGEARERLEAERDRLARERGALRGALQEGGPGEVQRLKAELDASRRHERSLAGELEEVRESEAGLSARLRALAEERPARATDAGEDGDRAAASAATWSLPVFRDEFYESIR